MENVLQARRLRVRRAKPLVWEAGLGVHGRIPSAQPVPCGQLKDGEETSSGMTASYSRTMFYLAVSGWHVPWPVRRES